MLKYNDIKRSVINNVLNSNSFMENNIDHVSDNHPTFHVLL